MPVVLEVFENRWSRGKERYWRPVTLGLWSFVSLAMEQKCASQVYSEVDLLIFGIEF